MRIGHDGMRARAWCALQSAALTLAAWMALGAVPARAEEAQVTVVLDSGERIDGTLVKSDLDHVYIRLVDTSHNQSITAILTYDRARIRRIEEASPSLPEYASRRAELPDTARAHSELARWCVDAELMPQARAEAERSEQLRHDPDTEALLLRLGMTYADGAWQDLDAYLARTGRVRYAGTIMSQEEAFRLQERASDDQVIHDTLAAISDDQALLAAVAREREALEARARQLSAELAAASDDLLGAQAALRRWREARPPRARARRGSGRSRGGARRDPARGPGGPGRHAGAARAPRRAGARCRRGARGAHRPGRARAGDPRRAQRGRVAPGGDARRRRARQPARALSARAGW